MVKFAVVKAQPKVPAKQINAGLRAFFQIVELWGLKTNHALILLGQPSKATFHNWKNGKYSSTGYALDLATRLSYVIGIFKALEILYQRPELADQWVSKPNLAFGGQSALDRLMGGQITDLAAVRDYLDSVRGGW